MAYGAADRDRGIHDIYISSNLKHFHGNRIECELAFPFPAPFSLLISRFAVPLIVLPCRWGGKIASMIKQPIVSSIVPPIVASLSCRLPCRFSRRSRRPVRLIRPSHQLVVRPLVSCRCPVIQPFAYHSSRSSPRCPDKQGGALSPYSVSPSPSRPSRLIRCRWM